MLGVGNWGGTHAATCVRVARGGRGGVLAHSCLTQTECMVVPYHHILKHQLRSGAGPHATLVLDALPQAEALHALLHDQHAVLARAGPAETAAM